MILFDLQVDARTEFTRLGYEFVFKFGSSGFETDLQFVNYLHYLSNYLTRRFFNCNVDFWSSAEPGIYVVWIDIHFKSLQKCKVEFETCLLNFAQEIESKFNFKFAKVL